MVHLEKRCSPVPCAPHLETFENSRTPTNEKLSSDNMSVIVVFLAKTIVPIGGLIAAEHYFLRDKLPQIYEASAAFPGLNLPKAFCAVIVINLVVTSLFLQFLGVKVGAARTTYKEKALKDGDKDAEDRFSYPKLYAEGFSQHAKLFNCVQRGHQHALETYPQYLVLSVIAGVKFPVTTTLGGLLWLLARTQWVEGYKTGDPAKRYQGWMAYGIWTSLIIIMVAALCTAGLIAM